MIPKSLSWMLHYTMNTPNSKVGERLNMLTNWNKMNDTSKKRWLISCLKVGSPRFILTHEIIIDEKTMVLHNKNSKEFPKLVVCIFLKFLPKCANINKDHVILFMSFKSSTWKKTWTPSFMLKKLKRKLIKVKRVCIATINKNLNITHFHLLFGGMET
jgi:hypothetical protein